MLDVGVGYVRVDWGEWSVVGFPGPEACTHCCNTAVKGGSVRGRAVLLGETNMMTIQSTTYESSSRFEVRASGSIAAG